MIDKIVNKIEYHLWDLAEKKWFNTVCALFPVLFIGSVFLYVGISYKIDSEKLKKQRFIVEIKEQQFLLTGYQLEEAKLYGLDLQCGEKSIFIGEESSFFYYQLTDTNKINLINCINP